MYSKTPKISIIMGIYNCEGTLSKSIDSILKQTYSNWELIMCDDGSTDGTYGLANEYAEKYSNIILIKNNTNKGLNYTLNRCLEYVTGKYVARQDGDDISLYNRLQTQIEFLENNPYYAIVSSSMVHFDEHGDWGRGRVIEKPDNIDFVNGTPFCHAASMVRSDVFKEVNGYTEKKYLLRVEDYHLWFKIYSKGYKGYNLKEPLYKMFDGRDAYKRRKYKFRINEAYVKMIGFNMLNIPLKYYVYALKPLLVGLVPEKIYKSIRRIKLNNDLY